MRLAWTAMTAGSSTSGHYDAPDPVGRADLVELVEEVAAHANTRHRAGWVEPDTRVTVEVYAPGHGTYRQTFREEVAA